MTLSRAMEMDAADRKTAKAIQAGDRVALFANTIAKEPPSRLVDDDGGPAEELMEFCRSTGMSLDWVFKGDMRSMIRATFRDSFRGERNAA